MWYIHLPLCVKYWIFPTSVKCKWVSKFIQTNSENSCNISEYLRRSSVMSNIDEQNLLCWVCFINCLKRNVLFLITALLLQLGFKLWYRHRILSLASVSRPVLRPTQSPIQWVPELKCAQGATLTIHPYLVARSMSRSYICSPPWWW
jgi:hypothetical protein